MERRPEEAIVTVTPEPAMTVAKSATVHAVSAAMATVTTTPGRSRGDGGSRQSECGDSRERNLAKHFVFSVRGVIA
jgi:hypothetical protein